MSNIINAAHLFGKTADTDFSVEALSVEDFDFVTNGKTLLFVHQMTGEEIYKGQNGYTTLMRQMTSNA